MEVNGGISIQRNTTQPWEHMNYNYTWHRLSYSFLSEKKKKKKKKIWTQQIHAMWFYLHKILKSPKLISGDRSQNSGYLQGIYIHWKSTQQRFWGAGDVLFLDLDTG